MTRSDPNGFDGELMAESPLHSRSTQISRTNMGWFVGFLFVLTIVAGCESRSIDRIVRVTNTDKHCPATNVTFVFWEDAPFEPLIKGRGPVTASLDTNGEARVRIRCTAGWARIDESQSKSYGTGLSAKNLVKGGRFRLFGAPPAPTDTNVYPSQYLLEISRP
jgi:hypothetical protein